MRFMRLVLFSMLALALLMAMSCSGGSPTAPPTTTAQGNGDLFPIDPQPGDPVKEIDPIPYPWWDCQRFFVYQGNISSWMDDGPHTIPLIINGNIRIRDKNCSAPVSKVRIRWGVNDLVGGVNNTPDWPRNLPGFKIKYNSGTLYFGMTYEEHNLLGGGYDITQRYVIWTCPDPSNTNPSLAGDIIDGWYHYRKHEWMMISGGEIIHTNHHTHLNINQGHEVFLEEYDPGA